MARLPLAPTGPSESEAASARWTLEGDDRGDFSLSSSSGATTMLRFRSSPNFEAPADTGTDNTYMVTVKATDRSNNTATRDVTVTVDDVDELGALSGPDSSRQLHGEQRRRRGNLHGRRRNLVAWRRRHGRLHASATAVILNFRMQPPTSRCPWAGLMSDTDTNTYMVTVKAAADGEMATQDVTVTVTNVEEPGTVTLSSMAPVVGTPLTANVTDLDVVMPDSVMWQWSKSMTMTMDGTFMDIYEATMPTYTPMATDGGYYLRATATYTDGYDIGNEEMATTTSAVVANNPPEFAEGETTREVPENSAAEAAVGDPVTATDADSGDTLAYTLSGDDDMYFTIDTSTGQIMVGMDTMLDHEAEKSTYMVTVTVTDGSDAPNDSAFIAVAINVTNVNEAPAFPSSTATRDVAENTEADMAIGEAFPEATDPDAEDSLTYSLGGDDADSFEFDASTRQIKTMAALDFESKSRYSVMVIATDSEDLTDAINVTINVTDVDENVAPAFPSETATRSIAENTAAGTNIGAPVAATDANDDTLTYALSGGDAMYFTIDNMAR